MIREEKKKVYYCDRCGARINEKGFEVELSGRRLDLLGNENKVKGMIHLCEDCAEDFFDGEYSTDESIFKTEDVVINPCVCCIDNLPKYYKDEEVEMPYSNAISPSNTLTINSNNLTSKLEKLNESIENFEDKLNEYKTNSKTKIEEEPKKDIGEKLGEKIIKEVKDISYRDILHNPFIFQDVIFKLMNNINSEEENFIKEAAATGELKNFLNKIMDEVVRNNYKKNC